MKADIIVQHLSIRVSSADRSYMPQTVIVSAGCDLDDIHEIRNVRIPRYTDLYKTYFLKKVCRFSKLL